jgi:hypothetical protein
MRAVPHTAVPGTASVFGVNQTDITLNGTASDAMNANLTGSSPQAPGVTVTVTLQRYCD